MRQDAIAEENRPTPVTRAPWRVAAANPLPGFRLHVRFNDGTEGIVNMRRQIFAQDAGVFVALADTEQFAKVGVDLGAVTWPCGIDLAPDAMHAEILANGEWTL